MDIEKLQQEADHFFEWDTENHDFVTLTSCLLFARHIAGLERDRCAAICDQQSVKGWPRAHAADCADLIRNT